jgi:hypothetical protein
MRGFLALAVIGAALFAAGLSGADEPARSDASAPCVDVQVGGEHAGDLACLNQKLRAFAARQQGVTVSAPVGTGSSSTAVGAANQAAAEQKMGNAFGKSAVPQRPNPVYVSPLVGPPPTH